MATKPEEPTTVPAEAAVPPLEKQPDAPATASTAQDPVTEKAPAEAAPAAPLEAPTEELKNLELSEKKPEDATTSVAAAPVPASDTKEDTNPTATLQWPETPADHPLSKLFSQVEELTKDAGHSEVYGITISSTNEFHTKLILQKFLRANQDDLEKAKQQLLDTLKWRKEFDPVKAAGETFEKSRFEGLGYILRVEGVPGSLNKSDVVTFNIYGAVKDNKKTFGDLEAFLRWRVGLMERSVQHLNLSSASQPIPDYGAGPDPYQGIQVHDYLQVSFFRQDPLVKAATKKTIEILGRCYPETLSRKFFVNVPVIMGWVYQAAKMLVSKETVKKFTVLSYGNALAGELGKGLPKEYGGEKGALVETGEAMKLEG
ncbi:CRAL/TRIO domain-containing protein [Bimuria novae-zelandiae CBS 107.79]|uniref:Phosphatidylinositol transfer protein SFH5 n=1 Tax=Bimuria novae-zelandiae CBS 107.79 TaxID=1447943 RepID=A0A6A5VS28_9PLEO|nr:CRAL/TRIO domain-containing protein [Bimuria novae-zelandiae CBS 107.79]